MTRDLKCVWGTNYLFRVALCVVACLPFFSLANAAAMAKKQAPSPPVANSPAKPQADQSRAESSQQGGTSAELAKESREAAGEDETAEFKHSPMVKRLAEFTGMSLEHAYWLSVLVNFAIVAALIFWPAKKYLPAIFRSRTASIQKALEEARKTSQEAKRRLSNIEARLSKLDVEIGEMGWAAEQEAANEEMRIKEAAEEDARKIVESAEQEIMAAAKLARRELKAYAADLAVSLAKNQIRVDPSTDQGLMRSFTEQLSANYSDGDRPKAGKG
jgi:F-type H+-transporting ATPase subunit b